MFSLGSAIFSLANRLYLCEPSRLVLWNTQTASLHRGKTLTNQCPGYDIKQSDGQTRVMLEICRMQNTSSLPLPPGPLCPGVVAHQRTLSIDQIKLSDI